MISEQDARALEECLAGGGIAVFPADTVYGICCSPTDAPAVQRIYELKGRPPDKPAAVMFFALAAALAELSDVPARTLEVVERMLPGAVTVLLANPRRRFPLACGPVPEVLGVRVPRLSPATQALGDVTVPVLQSSANVAGGPDARVVSEVPDALLEGVDLVLDAGLLPGTPSTVVDLTRLDEDGTWEIKRLGAVPADQIASAVRWNTAF